MENKSNKIDTPDQDSLKTSNKILKLYDKQGKLMGYDLPKKMILYLVNQSRKVIGKMNENLGIITKKQCAYEKTKTQRWGTKKFRGEPSPMVYKGISKMGRFKKRIYETEENQNQIDKID
jgi:hypothetical protein